MTINPSYFPTLPSYHLIRADRARPPAARWHRIKTTQQPVDENDSPSSPHLAILSFGRASSSLSLRRAFGNEGRMLFFCWEKVISR